MVANLKQIMSHAIDTLFLFKEEALDSEEVDDLAEFFWLMLYRGNGNYTREEEINAEIRMYLMDKLEDH